MMGSVCFVVAVLGIWWFFEDVIGGGWFIDRLKAVLGGAPGRVGGAIEEVSGGVWLWSIGEMNPCEEQDKRYTKKDKEETEEIS